MKRPTLTAAREELARYMWSGPWEALDLDEVTNEQFSIIEVSLEDVIAKMCGVLGHQWEHDQCGIPSHQYCLYCHTSITGRALLVQEKEAKAD